MKFPIRMALVLVTMLFASLATTAIASAAPPANDNFDNAIEVSADTDVAGTNEESTQEAGEPKYSNDEFGSVWYKFVAPSNGILAIDTCSGETNFDTVLSVFSGTAVDDLTLKARDDDDCGDGKSATSLAMRSGKTVHIQLAGYWEGAIGQFLMHVSFEATAPSPANDDFANATDLGDTSYAGFDSTTVDATSEDDEVLDDGVDSTVWFKWTAPRTGEVSFNTCDGPDGDAAVRLALYADTVDPVEEPTLADLDQVEVNYEENCGDDDSSPYGKKFNYWVTSGTQYWLQAINTPGEANTPFKLSVATAAINITLPVINGNAVVGQQLSVSDGTWGGAPLQDVNYFWGRCDADDVDGSSCDWPEDFTNQNTRDVTSADVGHKLRAEVWVRNAGGWSLGSAVTSVVTEAAVNPPATTVVPINPLEISPVPKSLGSIKTGAGSTIATKIVVVCGSTASGKCTGTAELTTKIKKKVVKIGTAKLSVSAGKTSKISVKLNSKGKKALKKAKKLKASLTVKLGAPGFAPRSVTTSLTIKK